VAGHLAQRLVLRNGSFCAGRFYRASPWAEPPLRGFRSPVVLAARQGTALFGEPPRPGRRGERELLNVSSLSVLTMPELLPLNRRFAMELHSRAIDDCQDIEELRRVAKTLLTAWQIQAGFSEQMAGELLGIQRSPAGGSQGA
jgi:hypothetical protein